MIETEIVEQKPGDLKHSKLPKGLLNELINHKSRLKQMQSS